VKSFGSNLVDLGDSKTILPVDLGKLKDISTSILGVKGKPAEVSKFVDQLLRYPQFESFLFIFNCILLYEDDGVQGIQFIFTATIQNDCRNGGVGRCRGHIKKEEERKKKNVKLC